jgi:hypothetical protein
MKGKSRVLFWMMMSLSMLEFLHACSYQPSRINEEAGNVLKHFPLEGVDIRKTDFLMSFFVFWGEMQREWYIEGWFAFLLFLLALSWYLSERSDAKKKK